MNIQYNDLQHLNDMMLTQIIYNPNSVWLNFDTRSDLDTKFHNITFEVHYKLLYTLKDNTELEWDGTSKTNKTNLNTLLEEAVKSYLLENGNLYIRFSNGEMLSLLYDHSSSEESYVIHFDHTTFIAVSMAGV